MMMRTLFVILLCGITITACDCEDDFVCPASGIDARLIGDWMPVNEDGSLRTLGLRIAADGSCYALGVDWATGLVGIAEEYCFFPRSLPCLGESTILWNDLWSGPDTLTYEVTESTLRFFHDGRIIPEMTYARIQKNQQIRQPVVSTISWICDSTNSAQGLHSVSPLPYWYTYPCSAILDSASGSITILGYTTGGNRFTCFIRDFNGPGKYDLGSHHELIALAGIGGICSDVAMNLTTQDDGLSTLTVTNYDRSKRRISGSFDLQLSNHDSIHMHIAGSFDGPVDIR
jgi:hypothetical protein